MVYKKLHNPKELSKTKADALNQHYVELTLFLRSVEEEPTMAVN